jgi:hypothetical protein
MSENLRLRRVVSTSKRSWLIGAEQVQARGTFGTQPPQTGTRDFPIAYILEGTFDSFFSDRPIPAKPQSEQPSNGGASDSEASTIVNAANQQAFLPTGEGKLFVMGTSTLLGSNVLDPHGEDPNALFLLNVLDYMNEYEERAGMRGKGKRISLIGETDPSHRTFVKAFNIGVIPALVALTGALVWLIGLVRKGRISRRFPDKMQRRAGP